MDVKKEQKESLTSGQIKGQYEKGRRNFDNVKSSGQDFHGFVLKGCSFRKADLSWSHFDTADLSGCDFTEANLMWSGIRNVNLRNTNFFKANVSYCDFSNSIFENTDFQKADLTATLLFNVNLGGAKTGGANMSWSATSIMQLDEAGLKFVLERLQQMGGQIPLELLTHIQLVVKKVHEKKEQLAQMKLAYGGPQAAGGEGTYSARIAALERDISALYGEFEGLYAKAFAYGGRGSGRKGVVYKK
jgi:hypothetical protein